MREATSCPTPPKENANDKQHIDKEHDAIRKVIIGDSKPVKQT